MMPDPIIVVSDNTVVLRDHDLRTLRRLHRDGAWRADEVAAELGTPDPLIAAGLIISSSTVIGPLTHLTPLGYRTIGVQARHMGSVTRHLNRAYVRLAVQHLGYTVGDGLEHLRQHDRTGLMVPVMTPHREYGDSGMALVGGSLPDGLSHTTMRRIIERHHSTALYHGYWVILVTPDSRRGQVYARRYPAWLKVIHVLPILRGRQRLRVTPAIDAVHTVTMSGADDG